MPGVFLTLLFYGIMNRKKFYKHNSQIHMNKTTIVSHLLIYITLVMFGFFFVASTTFATEVEIENETEVTIGTTDDDSDEDENEDEDDSDEDANHDEGDDDNDSSHTSDDDSDDTAEDSDDDSSNDNDDDMDEDAHDDDSREDNILRASIKARMDVQQERRQELQERKDVRQEAVQNRIEESRMIRIDTRVALGKRIIVRLDHIHDRLEAILGKISSRVEADDASNTTDIKEKTTEVQRHLNDAATDIINLETMINAWITVNTTSDAEQLSAELQANKGTFKETVQSAGQSLRSAHKSLKELVRMLKSYEKENRIETRVESETNVEI